MQSRTSTSAYSLNNILFSLAGIYILINLISRISSVQIATVERVQQSNYYKRFGKLSVTSDHENRYETIFSCRIMI